MREDLGITQKNVGIRTSESPDSQKRSLVIMRKDVVVLRSSSRNYEIRWVLFFHPVNAMHNLGDLQKKEKTQPPFPVAHFLTPGGNTGVVHKDHNYCYSSANIGTGSNILLTRILQTN